MLGPGSLYREGFSLPNSKSTSCSWLWAHSPCFTSDISVFLCLPCSFPSISDGTLIKFPLLGSSIPYFCFWYSINKYFSFSTLLIFLVRNFKTHFVSFLIINCFYYCQKYMCYSQIHQFQGKVIIFFPVLLNILKRRKHLLSKIIHLIPFWDYNPILGLSILNDEFWIKIVKLGEKQES